MEADAGENGSTRGATVELEAKPSSLIQGVRAACWFLWGITIVVELTLFARVATMLLQGVNDDGTGRTHFATVLYSLTGVVSGWFQPVADMSIPINGLPHALDVATLIAIDVIFFAVLAFTKLSIWTARWYVARSARKEYREAVDADKAPTRPPLVAEPVPVAAERSK